MSPSRPRTVSNWAGLTEHPQRHDLLAEVHARPVAEVQTPQHLTHLALYIGTSEQAREHELAHIAALCREIGITPPTARADHVLLETDHFRLRWEPHTEFSTYTLFSRHTGEQPFQTTGLDAVPVNWLKQLPGELLVACHLSLVSGDTVPAHNKQARDYFQATSLSGSLCAGGAATVWTDFQPQADGFTRFLVIDHYLQPAQAGRLIQRLTEVETYRLMVLLALPVVRHIRPDIARMEHRLGELTSHTANANSTEQEQQLLGSLTALSTHVEHNIAQHNFRLAITDAYATLAQTRMDNLREQRVEGVSTINEFVQRRLIPAADDCQALSRRLDQLSGRISRTVDLLRSRVDLAVEAQNRALLESMDRRTRLQVRLQTTAESLSVVILSYYIIGLIKYAVTAFDSVGFQLPADLITGISIPIVIVTVGVGVFALHRWVERVDGDPDEPEQSVHEQTSDNA